VADWDRANRLGELSIGISLGLHQHVPGESVEQSVAEADARMYMQKQRFHAQGAPETAPTS
jgi:hypothetical protein